MSDSSLSRTDRRLLVLVANRDDAALCASILATEELACHCCASVTELCRELDAGAGALLLDEEALAGDAREPLAAALARQTDGEEFPVLLVVAHGATSPALDWALAALPGLLVLERPLRAPLLVLAARNVLRARLRQSRLRAKRERLRDGEQRVRELLAILPTAVYGCDAEGRLTFWNARAEKLWGREPQLGERVHTGDSPVARVLRESASIQREQVEIEQPGGARVIALLSAEAILDRDGTPLGAIAALENVTRRRQIEAALVEMQSWFMLGQRAGGVGLFDWRIAEERVVWSPELEDIYGIARGSFAGTYEAWARHVAPEDLAAVEEITQRCIAERTEATSFEFRIVTAKQERRWIMCQAKFLFDAQGTPERMLGLNVDISKRREAEEALRESEVRFRTLAEAMPSAVWTASPDGAITWANRQWLDYSGLPLDEMPTFAEVALHPDDADRYWKELARALEEGRGFEAEVRVRRHDGVYRWLVTRAVPLRDAGGQVASWVGVSTDIHAHRSRSDALTEAGQRKDEFLATLAHELRNPLAPIRNSVQILKMAGPIDGEARRATEIAERQLAQMVRLIDDLLDVARITQGKLDLRRERTSLATIVESAVESARPLIEEKQHELVLSLPDEPLALQADLTRLSQVLANLLNNAAKYTPPGGRIWLSAARTGARELELTVRDSGIGIRADVLPRVFDLFVQVDRGADAPTGGLGIGLNLVKRLVELHGGTIEAASAGPGKGSEFRLSLPLLPATRAHAAPAASVAARGASKRRVLVVDDHQDSAESLARLLALAGHETEIAHDGEAALDAAARFRPEVVLLDIGLPRRDGYEVCRELRAQPWASGLALVAVSGWGQAEDRRRAREAGFDEHMTKPVDPRQLLEWLAERHAQT